MRRVPAKENSKKKRTPEQMAVATLLSDLANALDQEDRQAVRVVLFRLIHNKNLVWSQEQRAAMMTHLADVLDRFPMDQLTVGGACCAMFHASNATRDVPIDVDLVLRAVKPLRRKLKVVQAALRLLAWHFRNSKSLEEAVALSELGAWAIQRFQRDEHVQHYGIVLLMWTGSYHDDVKTSVDRDRVAVAVITGCVASRASNSAEYTIHGLEWKRHVLEKAWPRMRPRLK